LAPFWPHFAAIAPSWHPFGDVRGLFRLAFSAFARLEPQGEPFQHHFDDLVSFLVPLLHIFDAFLLKTHIIIASRLAPSMHPFSFPSSPLERVRCVVEAAPQARPEDHLGGIFRSSFMAEYHLGLTSALQHCQHNGAFRFLAAQVFSEFGLILGPHSESFLSSDGLNSVFF
jgi:hypothetical protein